MSEELDNIDELEALLAELDDLEEKSSKPEVKKPEPVDELSDDDLAELEELEIVRKVEARKVESDEELGSLEELESLIEGFAVVEQAETPKTEPAPADAEIEGLEEVLAEVESSAKTEEVAEPAPAASPTTEAVRRRRRSTAEDVAAPKSSKAKPAYVEEEGEEPGSLTPSLKTFIDPDQLQGDLEISESNLSKAMIRQAPLFARYSALSAKAQFQADRADQQVDLIEAELDSDIREDMTAKGIKITENLVKAAVIRHPKYQKAVTRYNEAKAIAEMVKTAADSFRHRRDMLIQMGADRREEMKGSVRVQEHPGAAALRTINGDK